MRTEQDINENQCDKCGRIQKDGKLWCWDGEDEYEGLALCNVCIKQLERKNKFVCVKCNKNIADLRFKNNSGCMGFYLKDVKEWVYYCPEHKSEVEKTINMERQIGDIKCQR